MVCCVVDAEGSRHTSAENSLEQHASTYARPVLRTQRRVVGLAAPSHEESKWSCESSGHHGLGGRLQVSEMGVGRTRGTTRSLHVGVTNDYVAGLTVAELGCRYGSMQAAQAI
jgi:hypothetical protein